MNISVAGDLDSAKANNAGSHADYTLSAVSTNGIEKILLSNFDTDEGTDGTGDNIVDAALMVGVTTLGLSASAAEGDTEFKSIKNLVTGEMRNGAADLTLTYNADVVTGTADTQNLTVSALTGGTFTANGAETIAITSELVKSTLTNVASDTLKKITVAGAADLTISTALTTTTIDASAATGAVSVKLGVGAQSVTGGKGADIIDAGANLGSTDTIAGGDGVDTLKLSVGNATIDVGTSVAKEELFNVSGIEVIDIASTNDGAALNLDNLNGVTTVVAAANQKTITVANGANSSDASETWSFTLNGTTYTTAVVSNAGDEAADDAAAAAAIAAKINTISGFSATSALGVVTVVATTGEALEISAVDDSVATTNATGTVAAYNDVTFTNLAAGTAVDIYSADAVTASLKDASGTADAMSINLKTVSVDKGFNKSVGTVTANNIETINLSATGMTDFKVTTVGALTGNAMKTLNITGDSDVTISAFTSSTALATIDGSTSTGDLILAAAPAAKDQSIKTGSGNDTIHMGAYLTAADTIDGGANSAADAIGTVGVDVVTATVTGLTATTGALHISNVERINLTNAGTAVIDATSVTGAKEIAFAEDASAVSTTVSNLAAGTAIGLGLNGTGNGANVLGTITASLKDATGTADSLTINLNDTTDSDTNTATLKVSGVETINLAYSTTATALASHTITATDLAAAKIVISGSDADTDNVVTLSSLNTATNNIDASAFKGKVVATTTATGAVTVSAYAPIAQNLTTGGGADTISLSGNAGTMVHSIDGGAGNDVLSITLDNAASDFTSVQNVETINITVGANKQAGFNDSTMDKGLNAATTVNVVGGDSLSSFTVGPVDGTGAVLDVATATKVLDASTFAGSLNLTTAAGALNSFRTIKGGAATTDSVTTTVSAATTATAKPNSMTGVETLVVNSTDNQSGGIDLANVTGLTTVEAKFATTTNADTITLSNLADGVNLKITSTKTADNLVVGLTNKAANNNSLNVELTAITDANGVVNLDVDGLETLTITNKDAADTTVVLLDGVVASTGSTTTVNVAGTAATKLTSMGSTITVVNASTATGALTVDAADRTSSAMTITGGEGADSIAFKNVADVLTGGNGSDTLVVSYTAILGGIQVDLSASDVITSIDGGSNAAVQTGFENVNLNAFAGFGAVVTGSSAANTITGTSLADNITAGLGADIITGGAGNDQITLTETTAASDTVKFSATASANGVDTIAGFKVAATASGGDVLDFTAFLGATPTALVTDTDGTAPTGATVLGGKVAVLIDIAGNQDITTAAGLTTAVDGGGEYANYNMGNNEKAIVITYASDSATTGNVFFLTSDGSAAITATLVGTIATDASVAGLAIGNFA